MFCFNLIWTWGRVWIGVDGRILSFDGLYPDYNQCLNCYAPGANNSNVLEMIPTWTAGQGTYRVYI